MSVIEINVSAKPIGQSCESGVDFEFEPSKYVAANGDITLPAKIGEVTLLFRLRTRTVQWPKGARDISFLVADTSDGKDSMWIWHETKGARGRYQGMVFSGFALNYDHTTGKPHMVLVVENANQVSETYQYKLSVGVITPTGIQRISHDPRIINGQN